MRTRFGVEPYQMLWLVHYYKTTFEISAIWWHLLVPFHIHASYTNDTQLCTERCMNGPHVDSFFCAACCYWSCLLQNACGLIWTWQMSQTGLGQWNVHESRWRDAWMSTTGSWTNTFDRSVALGIFSAAPSRIVILICLPLATLLSVCNAREASQNVVQF